MTEVDQATVVRNRAIGLLARREHSRLEMSRKLEQKGFEQADIQPVLTELEAENLLSDARYAEAFVHSRVERERGPLKIRAELSRNGVSEVLVEQVMASYHVDWRKLAANARRKRFELELPVEYSEKARQARFLSSRGFSSETIWQVLGDDI